jgi:flagellar hook-length control protein FliK
VPAATPVAGPIEGAGTSIGASPAPLNRTAIAPAAAPSAFESSAPAESVETETITAANPALPAEPGTEAETVVAASSKTADTDKPAKQTSAVNPTAGMPDVSNAARDTATQPVPSAEVQNASSDVGNSMPATIDTPPEPTSGHKGAAARLLARALERAAEAAAPHHVATAAGNGSQSFDGADPQSSFGDWLREQLPQAANAGAQSASAGTFNFVAPSAQHDVRVAGVISSPETSLMPGGPVLPREHDVTMQLVQSLRLQFRDGIGEAVLKLKPEHLGSVAISLRVENGGLKANVQADLPAVRQWLESQQDTLRSALAEHGLRLDRFDVEPDGHRHASPEEQQERSPRKRQTRRSPQSDQPVFEVVV